MSDEPTWKLLCARILPLLERGADDAELRTALSGEAPLDIALVIDRLPADQTPRVFAQLDPLRRAEVFAKLSPEQAAEAVKDIGEAEFNSLVSELPPRDAAQVVAAAPRELAREVLAAKSTPDDLAADVRNRLNYPEGSAGRLMTNDFVRLSRDATAAKALELVRGTDPLRDLPNNLYVVEAGGRPNASDEHLLGVVSIRDLVMAAPHRMVGDLMATDVVTLGPDAEDDEAANLLSKFKFLSLPIVDAKNRLLGVIPADDLMEVVVARLRRRYAQSVGADAEAMERMSPLGAAKLRTPWLIGTMFLELGAGLVIAHFNHILQQVILLASFMPVISAVSGNVGLQAAAITVRALDTGQVTLGERGAALVKEALTSLLMALICGVVLGGIGALWSRHVMLGLVIGVAMACSMLTAGLMGTIIPMISKKLGFDPATTAGPFETAFQDIVGFGVFLSLATLMSGWIT